VAQAVPRKLRRFSALSRKVRVWFLPDLSSGSQRPVQVIAGGFLVKHPKMWQLSAGGGSGGSVKRQVVASQPARIEMEELLFTRKVAKHVKSNAIVVTRSHHSRNWSRSNESRWLRQNCLGTGSRRIAGAVLASDGFFPSMTLSGSCCCGSTSDRSTRWRDWILSRQQTES